MIFDFTCRLIRKKIPQSWFYFLKRNAVKAKSSAEFFEIAKQYLSALPVADKLVLEAGSGNQLYTAIYLLNAGAREVIIVEPNIDEKIKQNVDWPAALAANLKIPLTEILQRIKIYKRGVDEKNLLPDYAQKIDVIFSHATLEHVADPEQAFKNFDFWLKPDGAMYHFVDFVDHFYYPLASIPILKLLFKNKFRHLAYSNKTWLILNDNKTCYLNRKILPHYKQCAQKFHFRIDQLEFKRGQSPAIIHPNILAELPSGYSTEYLNLENVKITFKR